MIVRLNDLVFGSLVLLEEQPNRADKKAGEKVQLGVAIPRQSQPMSFNFRFHSFGLRLWFAKTCNSFSSLSTVFGAHIEYRSILCCTLQ